MGNQTIRSTQGSTMPVITILPQTTPQPPPQTRIQSPLPKSYQQQPQPQTRIQTFPQAETISRKLWYNLKGKEFEENPNMWYNLNSNRMIKNQPGNPNVNLSLRGIRVIGTQEDLINFWKTNINQLTNVYPNGTQFQDVIFQPFGDITFLSEDVARRSGICYLGTAGTIIPPTRATDVEQLTSEEINAMCPFGFQGLFAKCRVIEVMDGDTIYVCMFVPLHQLGAARAIGPKGEARVGILPQESSLAINTGFFANVTIRIYGYDAQEKDTQEGQLAKRLLTDKIASLNNIVWCQFVEVTIAQEKYSRILGVLYEDQKKNHLLNDYLLRMERELTQREGRLIRLVNPYLGGTKQTFD